MKITKRTGVAGQYSLAADTEDGELTFVGSAYGGPVVMVTPTGHQTFVSDPGRFGDFGYEWVERFLA
jgi:hypothetical protein